LLPPGQEVCGAAARLVALRIEREAATERIGVVRDRRLGETRGASAGRTRVDLGDALIECGQQLVDVDGTGAKEALAHVAHVQRESLVEAARTGVELAIERGGRGLAYGWRDQRQAGATASSSATRVVTAVRNGQDDQGEQHTKG
jgi:hypothetical protein